jgi:hypothetical protein
MKKKEEPKLTDETADLLKAPQKPIPTLDTDTRIRTPFFQQVQNFAKQLPPKIQKKLGKEPSKGPTPSDFM